MELCTIDMETYYDPVYSLSKMTTEEYVRAPLFETIGFAAKFGNRPTDWVRGDQAASALAKIDWSDKMVIAQNTAFDGAIMGWRYGIKPAVWVDIMGMSRALFPHEKSHSLAAQAQRAGIGAKGDEVVKALGKRLADFTPEELHRYGQYCINDVELTYKLFNRYMEMGFPKKELRLIDLTLRMFIEPELVLDKPLLEQHYRAVVESKSAMLEKVRDKLIEGADPDYIQAVFAEGLDGIRKLLMSNDKFAYALEMFGVVPPMKKSPTTGKMTYAFAKTDEAFKALEEHEDTAVQALVAARLSNKTTLEETRTLRFIGMAARGKFPVPLRYYGAHSGRWSGEQSVNMQNLPSRGPLAGKIKKAIKAPPGYVVIDCDSSQIEARTLAWLAGQDDLVHAFRLKQDVYKLMASKIYGVKPEDVDKLQRQVGKTAVLGCFGPDTKVVTQRGWVPIIHVQATDKVWDGQSWVTHAGLVPQGEKDVWTAHGISATSDHEILTEHGWAAWSEVLENPSLWESAKSVGNLPSSGGSPTSLPEGGVSGGTRCVDAPAGGRASYSARISSRVAASVPCRPGSPPLKQRMPTYDIAYAGPRNRYTILSDEGPLVVHNCGYGVGHVKLQAFLKVQAGVEVTLEEAKRIIDTYRASAYKIKELWDMGNQGLRALLNGQSLTIDAVGLIRAVPGKGLTLPNGLHIQYPELRMRTDAESQKTEVVYTSKGLPVRIYGGKVVENVCQAVARCIVAEQMLRVAKFYRPVLTVHDAIAIIAPESEAKAAQECLEEAMSWNPKWAAGLPLACESGVGQSYGDC